MKWLSYLSGKPVLESSLHCLTTACLLKHEDFLYEELEPRDLCDFLFEEEAVDILSHDIITESKHRRKQVKFLLETLMENKNDCFYFFLYILQKKHYDYIRQTLEVNTSSYVEVGMFTFCSIKQFVHLRFFSTQRTSSTKYQHLDNYF